MTKVAKILILVLSELSSGELTIGYEFASRLDRTKHDVKYIVNDKFSLYLESRGESFVSLKIENGAKVNKQIVNNYLSEEKYDFILVSDVYTVEYSRLWSGVSLQMLKQYNIPILAVDEYEYLSTNCTPDYYGGNFEVLPHLFGECDYIIRNCPLNNQKYQSSKRVKYFSLYEKSQLVSEQEKSDMRLKLGIKPNEKVIFFASSSWENINFNKSPYLGKFIKYLPKIIQNYINDLNRQLTVIHVGPGPWEISKDSNINYINYTYCKPEDFDMYLFASDLFITTNVVSVTLSKAIMGNIPSIVLQNYKIINFDKLQDTLCKRPIWYQEIASEIGCVYPFRAGFFGWYHLLEKVLEDNDYTSTYEVAQLFNYKDVIDKLTSYLFDEKKISQLIEKQNRYVSKLTELKSPNAVMEEVITDVRCREQAVDFIKISDFYKQLSICPSINLRSGREDNYIIHMKNLYLDKEGNIKKWQSLQTDYIRIIKDELSSFCVLTELRVNEAEYESSEKNKMKWNFVKGHKAPYFLCSANTQEQENFVSNEIIYSKIQKQLDKFYKSFQMFPKLPSVYLYVMQLYDIVAFENFSIHFSSMNTDYNSIGKTFEIESLSEVKAQIGLGLYEDNSVFCNGKFYATYLGVTVYKGRQCAIYNYDCGKSGVEVEDEKMNETRKGSSYYSGTVLLDLKTYIPVYGTMIENYIATQKNHMQDTVVRRQVSLEIAD